jgi:hypothetical protein
MSTDVKIDLATAVARGELLHDLGPRFDLVELSQLGAPVDCSIGESEDCAPGARYPADSQLSFGQAVVRAREELQALDFDGFMRVALIVLGESPWGVTDEELRALIEGTPSVDGGGLAPCPSS